jgi:hypothetical protein
MSDLDIGMSADYGRPNDDGAQTYEEAEREALGLFWIAYGRDARALWGDDIECAPGANSNLVNIYRRHDHKLLSDQSVMRYANTADEEWEAD